MFGSGFLGGMLFIWILLSQDAMVLDVTSSLSTVVEKETSISTVLENGTSISTEETSPRSWAGWHSIEEVGAMSDAQVEDALRSRGQDPIPKPPPGTNDDEEDEDGNTTGWKRELFGRLDRVRLLCGELCTLNTLPRIQEHYESPNQSPEDELKHGFLPTVVVPNLSCPNLMAMEEIDAGDMTFPVRIPKELLDFYTLNNAYHVGWDRIRKDAYLGGASEKSLWKTGNVWHKKDIDDAVNEVKEGTLKGSYGVEETNLLRDTLSQVDMKGKSVLVIGSSHPWVEAICLYHGAKRVVTLEYGTIDSRHPQIDTEVPDTLRQKYLSGDLEPFDGIITHSSMEHSGLGRYGDALNPWGDILGLARGWCVTKPGAFLWLGIPTGKDFVFFNWHRVYGKYRWPLIATNWKQIGSGIRNETIEEKFQRGPWQSMQNEGFIFRKLDV